MSTLYLTREISRYCMRKKVPHFFTGSYAIGGWEEGRSDIDICILATPSGPSDMHDCLESIVGKLEYGGSLKHKGGEAESYYTMDKKLNIIFHYDEGHFTAWWQATIIARDLELHDRPYRVELFEDFKRETTKRQSKRKKAPELVDGPPPF